MGELSAVVWGGEFSAEKLTKDDSFSAAIL